jgi:ubiquitin-like-conjugating enzyme ATG3
MEDFFKTIKKGAKAVKKGAKNLVKDNDTFHSVKNMALSSALGVGENFVPILKESRFYEKGILTPEEYIQAGDLLITRYPTWSWMPASSLEKTRSYLPKDKQYLVTRSVPAVKRISELDVTVIEKINMDGWTALMDTYEYSEKKYEKLDNIDDILDDIDDSEEITTEVTDPPSHESDVPDPEDPSHESDVPDPEDPSHESDVPVEVETVVNLPKSEIFEDGWINPDDDIPIFNKNVVRTRTYDVSITYDRYYQVPRVWLSGSDEYGSPLAPTNIFEDIMKDYRNRTVTVEEHPHKGGIHVSIHPCKHSNVMKKLIDNLVESSNNGDNKFCNLPRPNQYMVIFLKFIQNVIPTISYDQTESVRMK